MRCNLTFSEQVKNEIIGNKLKTEAERRALFSGLVRSGGTIVLSSGKPKIELTLDSRELCAFSSDLALSLLSVSPNADGRTLTFSDGEKILMYTKFMREDDGVMYANGIDGSFTNSAAVASAYLSGVFLATGNVSILKDGGYHLEFSLSSELFAADLEEFLIKYEIPTHAHEKKKNDTVLLYLKDNVAISDCLALMGAHKAVLKLNEVVADRSFNARNNRMLNCEAANAQKVADVAVKQVFAIMYLNLRGGLKTLPVKLHETAVARLDDKSASYQALADKLGITKSGLRHRLSKLTEIAEELAAKRGEVIVEVIGDLVG